MRMARSKWFLPLFAVALGIVISSRSGSAATPSGLVSIAILVVFGALVLLLGGRSETIRGLRGDGRDDASAGSISTLPLSPASR